MSTSKRQSSAHQRAREMSRPVTFTELGRFRERLLRLVLRARNRLNSGDPRTIAAQAALAAIDRLLLACRTTRRLPEPEHPF